MDNLWPKIEELSIEENKALEIINEQAEYLNEMTRSKVKAALIQVGYEQDRIGLNVFATANAISNVLNGTKTEIENDYFKQKEDINKIFDSTSYRFEIFSDKYRFRVFTLIYSITYPITMNLDEGIATELKSQSKYLINNNKEVTLLLSRILKSKKVITILNRLMANEK